MIKCISTVHCDFLYSSMSIRKCDISIVLYILQCLLCDVTPLVCYTCVDVNFKSPLIGIRVDLSNNEKCRDLIEFEVPSISCPHTDYVCATITGNATTTTGICMVSL